MSVTKIEHLSIIQLPSVIPAKAGMNIGMNCYVLVFSNYQCSILVTLNSTLRAPSCPWWFNFSFSLTRDTVPFGYHAVAALEKMATAHIDSFGREEILEFLNQWANALFPDEKERTREAYLPELESAVLNMPRIRRMAKNPVMLTCLCVVHWNERKLPEGKADLLAAVLRWLLNAKEEKRRHRGYSNTFAEECFKALARAMTNHKDGKQVRADLTWAAEQLAVPFLDKLGVQRDRLRKKGIFFLEAEMLDSGIVEQAESGDIRFWHYTFQEHYVARVLAELSDANGPDGWGQAVKPQW